MTTLPFLFATILFCAAALMFWHHKVFQVYLVFSLTQAWNQTLHKVSFYYRIVFRHQHLGSFNCGVVFGNQGLGARCATGILLLPVLCQWAELRGNVCTYTSPCIDTHSYVMCGCGGYLYLSIYLSIHLSVYVSIDHLSSIYHVWMIHIWVIIDIFELYLLLDSCIVYVLSVFCSSSWSVFSGFNWALIMTQIHVHST